MSKRWLAIWIFFNAGWSQAEPPQKPADLSKYEATLKDADRQHWAFQPVRQPVSPVARDAAWVRNPIDAFVLAKLEVQGWRPAAPAEPRALLRRIYLDLIGLPPTPAEQEAFLADASPLAWNRLIDELMSRPEYGERWGRHWLDLARFAETNGYERDATKPHAWRFRDYVIRSFNEDKPFDRFIMEQLAGDELPESNADTLIATGYHRLGPWDDEPADPDEDRYDQLDDMISTTSQVFLGLTLGCARCHNHKFEPLGAHDYYRMVAIFNPLKRPQAGRTELDLPVGSRIEIAKLNERDRRMGDLIRDMMTYRRAAIRHPLGALGLTSSRFGAVAAALVMPNAPALDEALGKIAGTELEIALLRETVPDLPRGYFLHEPSAQPPATRLLIRGKPSRLGPQVEPGVPAVLASAQPTFASATGASTSQRRLALAGWIARPDNPLTARVIVNRVWQFHFGEGLVRTPSDFGTKGQPPTHPELLDWLADLFVKDGWSIKKLHRLILSSNTYRMSKRWNAEYGDKDPENNLLWRFPYRRLEVEAIRDSMLAASAQLNRKMYGPSMFPYVPKEALEGHSDPDKIWTASGEIEASRRTIYAFVKRSMVVPMLEVLDLCDTARSSAKRAVTTVAPQALSLFNGDFTNRQAAYFARRLVVEAGDDQEKQIERAFILALCRPPTSHEQKKMATYLRGEEAKLLAEAAGKRLTPEDARRQSLTQLCRVIFNLNEFVYPD